MPTNAFSFSEGIFLLMVFFLAMIALVSPWMWRRNSVDLFLVANRKIGPIVGALSVAVAWIWAPALFVSSQKAYQQGIPGAFWFVAPNALALILFAFLATRIRAVMDQGYTLPEFVRHRMGKHSQTIYVITILVAQTYAVIVQLTGSLLLLNLLTGISKTILLVIIGSLFLVLAGSRGIRSSVLIDMVKAAMVTVVTLIVIPWAITKAGGFSVVTNGLGGVDGTYNDLFNPMVAWTFGVPITISLLSGVVIDQQQWQRAFSIQRHWVHAAFVIGGILFAFVPAALALLGFIAANPTSGVEVGNAQLSGVATVAHFLPKIGIVIFTMMVMAGLASAGSAALCAVSSVGGIDIYRQYLRPGATEKQIIRASRVTMVAVLLLAMTIALLPNVQILHVQLLVGSFRAALLVPTVLALYWRRLSGAAAFWGMLMGMLVGVPLFVYGSAVNNATISTLGSLLPILISLLFCTLGSYRRKVVFDYDQLAQAYAPIKSQPATLMDAPNIA